MVRRKRKSYKFTEKTHSKKAIVSSVMAGCSLLMYWIFVYLSYNTAGTLSTYYGGGGFLAMMIAVIALGISIPTLKEEDSFPLFPRMALLMSILSTFLWVGTYILGFLRG